LPANIKAGKLRALAVTTAQRSTAVPEVPAIGETSASLARVDVNTWFGVFGPANLPPEQTQHLNGAFVDALKSPER
jgi:tripartite-type tricarboxylate transporter receptor subunit TctC